MEVSSRCGFSCLQRLYWVGPLGWALDVVSACFWAFRRVSSQGCFPCFGIASRPPVSEISTSGSTAGGGGGGSLGLSIRMRGLPVFFH
jgi:hypothetical protein